ncbi:MAG: FtsX-like permease family protein [Saccharospirillum sp.]|nr:FtsX-like permease family protein [Saccharospirillum sp.]
MGLNWRLALRNLTRNTRRTLLTGMVISLSTAALVVTDAFILGFMDTTVRSATRMYSGDAQMHHRDFLDERDEAFIIANPDHHLDQLAAAAQVANATPRVLAFGMISSAADNRAVQVTGIDPEREAAVSKIREAMTAGDYLTEAGDDTQILLGERLADLLEVGLGDRLVVSVNNQDDGGVDQQLFRVSGLFHFNARMLDENMVFVLLPKLQSMMAIEGVHEIAWIMHSASLASERDLPLWQALSTEDVTAQGWTTLIPQLASMLELTGASMAVIGGILFILAGLSVTNGIFMSIYERTWEIGVLLAIGTRRRSIFRLILTETFLLAIGAIALGLLLGFGLTIWLAAVGIDYGNMEISGVSLAEVIRPVVDSRQYQLYPFWVLLLTLVAATYPALHAARIVPARALQKSL